MTSIERGLVSTALRWFLCCQWIVYGFPTSLASEFGFRFETWPTWEVVTPGDMITLRCATNLRPDSIRWQHNHRYLPVPSGRNSVADGGRMRIVHDGVRGSGLSFKISEETYESSQQEGLYQCVASVGSISVTSLPGHIKIAVLKPYEREMPSVHSLTVSEGHVFRIACERPKSVPRASLQFQHDDQFLDLTDESKYHVTEDGDLIVLDATFSSIGRYACRAYNSALQKTVEYPMKSNVLVKKKTEKSRVLSPLRLITFDSVINKGLGDRIRLLCICMDCEGHLYWTLRGSSTPLADSSDGDKVSLVIREATVHDEGIYRCHGNNSFGYSFIDVTLYIQTPPFVIKGPDSPSVSEKSTTSLECTFGGSPPPTVAWVFNGKLLANSQSFRISGNKIELSSVEKNQAGIYQCFGFNPFGSAQETAVVTVIPKTITAPSFSPIDVPKESSNEREIDMLLESEDEMEKSNKEERKKKKKKKKERKPKRKYNKSKMITPSAPNITKLSDESVMVTWDMESEDGIPIAFFKVQYRVLEGPEKDSLGRGWKTIDEDIQSHVKSFEVTGLKTNHLYRFRVLAAYINNDNQPGESSKKFFLEKEIRLKNPESSPQITHLLPVDDTSLAVAWNYEPKTQTEGFIIYYRESTSAADYIKVTLLGPERRNYTVAHLKPRIPYDFKMASFNMAGTSDFSTRITFRPEGLNYTDEDMGTETPSTATWPVVTSDPEFLLSDHLLYITLGAGLGVLILIVIVSYSIYSCKKKNSGEETNSKFSDTSLRIHRLSSADIRKQNGCQCGNSSENEIPLLDTIGAQGSMGEDTLQGRTQSNVSKKENGNARIMRETSFVGNDQPPNMYGESS